ncbi:MAG: hypothetical protein ACLQVL_03260 [Terriglobia bacterium]
MGNANFLPSPLWGRGWLASGVLISRGETGEGVETVGSPPPYRKARSLARTTGQMDNARELRRWSTEAVQAAWHLLRKLRLRDSGSAASILWNRTLPTFVAGSGA